MAFQPVPDVAEFAIEYTFPDGLMAYNILHMREAFVTGWDAVALNAGIDILVDWDNNWNQGVRSNEVLMTAIRARDLTTAAGAVESRALSMAGDVASPTLPGNVTLAVSLRTGFAGRSFRGRQFITGIPESQVSANHVITGYAAGVIEAYEELLAATSGGSIIPVIVSRWDAGVLRNPAIATNITQVLLVDTRIDTMRKRVL